VGRVSERHPVLQVGEKNYLSFAKVITSGKKDP
jgi:hypothetical protein